MSRRPKNRRSTNRCWMCKMEKLLGLPTRQEQASALAAREQCQYPAGPTRRLRDWDDA